MTRDEAVVAEICRAARACADHQQHLAHIRVLAVRRLRGIAPYDAGHLDDDSAGDWLFGDDHAHPITDLPLAA